MMVHPSPLELLIMDTLLQEPSRMLSADTQHKPATMSPEGSAGIATDFPCNTKLINN